MFFFFNDTATTEIYTLSLHDALPISRRRRARRAMTTRLEIASLGFHDVTDDPFLSRSEEHTSELQSQSNLVCRLLLEKKYIRDPPSQIQLHPTRRISDYATPSAQSLS